MCNSVHLKDLLNIVNKILKAIWESLQTGAAKNFLEIVKIIKFLLIIIGISIILSKMTKRVLDKHLENRI